MTKKIKRADREQVTENRWQISKGKQKEDITKKIKIADREQVTENR